MNAYGKIIAALVLCFGVLAGCQKNAETVETAAVGQEETAKEKEQEEQVKDGSAALEEAEGEQEEQVLLYSVMAEGIDYLSVEGIQVPEGAWIAMVGKDADMAYWKALKKGAEQAVEDLNQALSYTGNKKIKLLYDAPENEDVEEQIDIIDQMLDKNPEVLCIGFVDVNSGSTQLELAQANGIPVLTMDSGIENELVKTSVQTDNMEAGRKAAQNFCEALGGSGKIALLVHSPETETGIDREQGFIAAMQEQYLKVELVDVLYLNEDQSATLEEIKEILAENPDLKGFFATNQTATELLLEAMKEMEAEEGQQTLVLGGFDSGEAELAALEDGRLSGTMSQNPYAMGYAAAVAAAREAAGMENAPMVFTHSYWITAENLEDELIQEVIYQ